MGNMFAIWSHLKIFDIKHMFNQNFGKQKYIYTFSHVREDEYFLVLCCGSSVIFTRRKNRDGYGSENVFRVEKKKVAENNFVFYHNKININKCLYSSSVVNLHI